MQISKLNLNNITSKVSFFSHFGSKRHLNEWEFDYSDTLKEWEPNHRHIFHMLFPFGR
jgi:hypothetical protein